MTPQITFKHLTISGGIATGTTTLLNNLKPHLEPFGWSFYSGGGFVREFVKKNGLKLEDAESRGDAFTKELDRGIINLLKGDKHIAIESWLAGFDAQGIGGVLKVLLVCSDESLVIDRVVNRDNVSVDEAKKHIRERTSGNFAKWKRIYGVENVWDEKYYDIVIDTYKNGPTEVVDIVMNALQK